MKYAHVVVYSVILNIVLSTLQVFLFTDSATSDIIRNFLETAPQWAIVVFYFLTIILIPIFEELLFRGLLWKLFSYFLSTRNVAIVIAIMFAFAHTWQTALLLVPFSIYLSFLRVKHDSLKPGIASHIAFNATGLLLPLLF